MAIIAVDAMGGDEAPGPEVAGAVLAARMGHNPVLLGDEAVLRAELARLGARLPIVHAREVITMHDHPGQAVRSKRHSSMRLAFEMVKKGEAQAVLSCGNSGAMLACGLFVLGRLPGVERPGIVVHFPTLFQGGADPGDEAGGGWRIGQCALLDMGANVDCKPTHLAQFAVLGATMARLHDPRITRPRVGLLANGEEASKGTETLREAHALLRRDTPTDFEYVGFVEGRDIFHASRDPGRPLHVVVTDGFTGNVVLKSAEGAARFLGDLLRLQIRRSLLCRLGAVLMRPALRALARMIDVERRGGALLLGTKGVVIICHGRSSPRAIASAIALASEQATSGLAPALIDAMERHRPLWADAPQDPQE